MSVPAYQNPDLTVEERVDDLLSRMTLPEKVGQLMQLDGRNDLNESVNHYGAGSLLHILGDQTNRAIDLASQTRLGIPILFGEDCIHGHSFWRGATIFPTQLAMACAWNPELLHEVARVTAREVRPTGPRWTFSPVLCLTRDLRWGRVNETFGEDPYLIGEFAAAMIKGYQGDDWTADDSILATAKHYAGYSETQGGRDASEADLSRRKLLSYFLPPFQRAVEAGCMTFMTGYQSIEGVPSTANRWLLTEVLKEQWGFEGIVVTDWDNVGRMHWEQRICASLKEASALAIKSGNDLMMSTTGFFEGAQEAVAEGLVTESEIDALVRRVLSLKFALGLFENPGRADSEKAAAIVGCAEHRAVNIAAARQSLVLLRNEGDFLPLDVSQPRRVAVIGPNADDPLATLGDWSLGTGQMGPNGSTHPREMIATVLDGLKEVAPDGWSIEFAKGCSITDASTAEIPVALDTARAADIVVLCVGDSIQFVGEGKSTATLELQGGQKQLVREIMALGKPVIVVFVGSKPMVFPDELHEAPAFLCAFNPGMAGGQAVAEAIFGHLNPTGKLTISFPKHVGQQPIFYSQVRGQHGVRYADLDQDPMFAFGEGLSYTQFEYTNLRLGTDAARIGDVITASVDVTNVGERDGTIITQAYVSDEVTSVTWVQKQLKGFDRNVLHAGETKTIEIKLDTSDWSIVDAECNRLVEPGWFEVQVGCSSRDRDLLKARIKLS